VPDLSGALGTMHGATRSSATPPPSSLRERKKLRTRDALSLAALDLARRHGFEKMTVEQIAAEADVSRRTFFRYFATKEAALFPHHVARITRFRALVRFGPEGEEPFEAVRRAFHRLAEDWMREREEIVAQQRVVDASPALIAFERTLDREWDREVALALNAHSSRAATAGRAAPSARATRIFAGATMGAIRAALRVWFDADGRIDLVALGRETFDQLAPIGHAVLGNGPRPRPRPRHQRR